MARPEPADPRRRRGGGQRTGHWRLGRRRFRRRAVGRLRGANVFAVTHPRQGRDRPRARCPAGRRAADGPGAGIGSRIDGRRGRRGRWQCIRRLARRAAAWGSLCRGRSHRRTRRAARPAHALPEGPAPARVHRHHARPCLPVCWTCIQAGALQPVVRAVYALATAPLRNPTSSARRRQARSCSCPEPENRLRNKIDLRKLPAFQCPEGLRGHDATRERARGCRRTVPDASRRQLPDTGARAGPWRAALLAHRAHAGADCRRAPAVQARAHARSRR